MVKKRSDRIDRRWFSSKGYVFMYRPDHPNSTPKGTISEHRFILEGYLRETNPNHPALNNGYLSKDWHVHHLNGIRNDNRIENLQAILPADHYKIRNNGWITDPQFVIKHRWKESHKVSKICLTCGSTFLMFRSQSVRHIGSGKYCSRSCKRT